MGQPNVNQIQNQFLSQGQFPGSGPGVGTAQPGMTQPGAQAGMAQVSWPGVILSVDVWRGTLMFLQRTSVDIEARIV